MRLHDVLVFGSFNGRHFKSVKIKKENKKDLLIDHEFYLWLLAGEVSPSMDSELVREHLDMFDSEEDRAKELSTISNMVSVAEQYIEMFDVSQNGEIEVRLY